MRRRLVLTITGVATAAVVLFALPLGIALQRNYRDEELLRLQRDTVAVTRVLDVSPGHDPVELPTTGDVLAVYDRSGRRIAGRGPVLADHVVQMTLATGRPSDRAASGQLIAAVPLLTGERVAGVVRAARSDAAVTRLAHRAWLKLAALAAGVVALAALAALVAGRRLAIPLERLTAAARRLGEGDFTVRAPRSSVAEVDAVGAALDATAERLGDLVSRERAFSADASHQLRTPLAALRLELEAIELRDGASVELRAALEQVDRLQGTVDTLLAVARDVPRRPVATDLGAIVDEVAGRWRGALAAEGRPVRAVLRASPASAAAAPRVVTEVLEVLVDNARSHGAGAVTLTVRAVDGWLAIDVADEGPGFDGDVETAFARRSGSGHGIGLALARSLAHAEGGRLHVTKPGAHPVLTLMLPAVSADERSAPR